MSPLDRIVVILDNALATLAGQPVQSVGNDPAEHVQQGNLTDVEREEAARLMRVNHVGEICAQALYQGQSLTARDEAVRCAFLQAAREENDHLFWCDNRIKALGGKKSFLNPFWYGGAFVMGALAGLAGDSAPLSFAVEPERQVEGHLSQHIDRLPRADRKSRTVLEQMRKDEQRHARTARRAGGSTLPLTVRFLMRTAGRVMTNTAYHL